MIDQILKELRSKKRRMGCVSATNWFCKRLKNFKPKRLHNYTKDGDYFSHVIATDGIIEIDLAPYSNRPN